MPARLSSPDLSGRGLVLGSPSRWARAPESGAEGRRALPGLRLSIRSARGSKCACGPGGGKAKGCTCFCAIVLWLERK